MQPKFLLVQAILLLYWENRAAGLTGDSREALGTAIKAMPLPEAAVELDSDRDTLIGLKYLAADMAEQPLTELFDIQVLKTRLKLCCGHNVPLYSIFDEGIIELDDATEIKRKCVAYGKAIGSFIRKRDFEDVLKKLVHKTLYSGEDYNLQDVALEFTQSVEPFGTSSGGERAEDVVGMLGYVDFDCEDEIADLFREAQEETSSDGILKTGYLSINDMCGDRQGFRRGDTILVGALQHNYKTGFTLNLTRQIAAINTPWMKDEKKKPLILHISSENALTDNLLLTYQQIKENITGEAVSTSDVDPAEAARFIKEETLKTGYSFKMMKVNPSEFTYALLFQLINQLEADGYEIHLMTIDYLNMFNKQGCTLGATGSDVRDLFRRVRNFCHARGITFITPHQISSDAKRLLRMGIDEADFLNEIVNKGFYDSCTTIDQEVDLEILIHIVKLNGKSYLTCRRGKHRKSGAQTPDEHLACVLPFYPVGAVRDDYGKVNEKLSSVGGKRIADGGGDAWHH